MASRKKPNAVAKTQIVIDANSPNIDDPISLVDSNGECVGDAVICDSGTEILALNRSNANESLIAEPSSNGKIKQPRRDLPCGSVDKCLPHLVAGWAWAPDMPHAPLSIQIIDADNEIIAQFYAGKYRQDLADAGIGDGCHAFEFRPFGYSHRLLSRPLFFVIVETGERLPFNVGAHEPEINDHGWGSSKVHSNDPAAERIYKSIDDIYNTLETHFPTAALAANGLPSRLRPFIPKTLDVIFLIGLREGESKRYRVFNILKALQRHGFRCGAYYVEEIDAIMAQRPHFQTLVIFRAPLTPDVKALIDFARSVRARTVWDVDDYIFETRIIPQIDGIRFLTSEQKIRNAEGMRLYKQCLLAVDHATATTEYLAQRMRDCGQTVTVIPNTLNDDQIDACRDGFNLRNSDVITIGFFAGTRTHDRDFLEVRDALLHTMHKFVNTRLVVVGYLDIENDRELRSSEIGLRR